MDIKTNKKFSLSSFSLNSMFLGSLLVASTLMHSINAQEVETSSANLVHTVNVANIEIDTLVELDALVEAISQSTVSSQVNAKVKNIYVDVDDKVATGTLLLELDDTELKAQLAKAQASLNVAKAQAAQADSEYKRLQSLKSSSFVSASDMTKASAAVKVARANINLANAQISQVKQQLSYTKIIAPYSGVVTARHIEVGESANVGQPLLTGFALNQNRISVHVPNSLIHSVESNQSLLVNQSPNDSAKKQWLDLGNLTIAPSADPVTHTVMVRANIDKAQFKQRPGSFIKVAVNTDSRTALVIPQSSLVQQGDLSAVYVKLGDSFVLRQVIVSQSLSNTNSDLNQSVEVLSGLTVNDVIVKSGAEFLAGQHLTHHLSANASSANQ